MAFTTTTTVSSAIKTEFELDVQIKVDKQLIFERFAVRRPIEKGAGGTYRVNRLLSLPKVTTTTSEGSYTGVAAAGKFDSEALEFTPIVFDDARAITREASWDAILKMEHYRKAIADQIARSLNYYGHKQINTNSIRIRVDADSDRELAGTPSAADGTTVTSTDFAGKSDAWASGGGYMCMTNPQAPCYGESKIVTAFDGGTDVATVNFTNTPSTSSKFYIGCSDGITSADIFNTTVLKRAAFYHKLLQTPKFDDGVLYGFLHPQQEFDIWSDTTWENSAIYDDSGRFKNYTLVRWAGINMLIPSEGYREDTDGTENEDGAVYLGCIFGMEAYTIAKWGQGNGAFAVKITTVEGPDRVDVHGYIKVLGWTTRFSLPVINAAKIITIITGASDEGLLVR